MFLSRMTTARVGIEGAPQLFEIGKALNCWRIKHYLHSRWDGYLSMHFIVAFAGFVFDWPYFKATAPTRSRSRSSTEVVCRCLLVVLGRGSVGHVVVALELDVGCIGWLKQLLRKLGGAKCTPAPHHAL